LRSLAGIFLA